MEFKEVKREINNLEYSITHYMGNSYRTELLNELKTLLSEHAEMLEMLEVLLKEPRIIEAISIAGENSILNDNIKKAKQLIKKVTEI